jgi:hypothetical protein
MPASSSSSSRREQRMWCRFCSGLASFRCQMCSSGYCVQHADDARETMVSGLKHHIGICGISQGLVCENCWILDDRGPITCLGHREGE